jgi:hypothetical protein
MTGFNLGRRWRVSLVGQAPTDAPDEWVAALAAVALDLRCRRHGRAISFDGVVWVLSVIAGDWVSIGMAKLTDDSDLGEFSIGRSYALETTSEQAMVGVAEVIQEELAGYEFVQWRSDGGRMRSPVLRNGDAVWVDPSTNCVVSSGALCVAGRA